MDAAGILQAIDAEIDRLQRARALLTDHPVPLERGLPTTGRRKVRAESRARMAAAQKARWAKVRK